MHYMKVDDVFEGIMSHGRGTLLAKFDVESAYRNVPVHSDDRYLLGMKWRGKYFVDLAFPFGLCSTPYIFLLLRICLSGFSNTITAYGFCYIVR